MSFYQHQLIAQSQMDSLPSQLKKLIFSNSDQPTAQKLPLHKSKYLENAWNRIRYEAETLAQQEPVLSQMADAAILNQTSIAGSIAFILSRRLAGTEVSEEALRWVIISAFDLNPALQEIVYEDIFAVCDRDPTCRKLLHPILFLKGFSALQAFRIAHHYWSIGRQDLAAFIQTRVSEVYAVDIHPAAKIGRGVVLDHGHSIVVGETAVIGDNVYIHHSVTLGGVGKVAIDRHPKVGNNVSIGAGANILGNIEIGDGAKIAAGSVVLKDVLIGSTVAGVPAKPIVKKRKKAAVLQKQI